MRGIQRSAKKAYLGGRVATPEIRLGIRHGATSDIKIEIPYDCRSPISDSSAKHLVCDLCLSECGSLGIQYMADSKYPHYRCCDECDNVLLDLVIVGKGYLKMSTITDMEKTAIEESRAAFGKAVVETIGYGKATEIFSSVGEAGADFIIYSIWEALRISMRKQSAMGAVPVPVNDGPNDAIPF